MNAYCIVALLLLLPALNAPAAERSELGPSGRPPNIVFLLADDLGYGESGSFGQREIETPHLDRMAAEGMRFTRHYSGSPVCAPSRAVLMTGLHPGHSPIRDNRTIEPEGQEALPADAVTLPKLLKAEGYRTGAFGKWGLGGPGTSGDPLEQGFDRFFGYNCQRHAHNYYPAYLWDDRRRVALNNPPFAAHQKLPEEADARAPESYAGYPGAMYAPDLYTEQALRFILQNRRRAFFLYYATTVPHVALQVPADSLGEYLGKWPEIPYSGARGYLPHPTPRAAYAAMITRMDRDIGRILGLIKELGLDNDTLIIFTSDNGAVDDVGGVDVENFNSNGGLRSGKRWVYEGGVRVPLIVRWPGKIAPARISDRITGFEDWLPTLLEAIGAPERTPRQIDGISFVPTLLDRSQPARPFLYREFPAFGGQQAVWLGNWKGVRSGLMHKPPDHRIELYDLARDAGETTDVASVHPEIVEKITEVMRAEHRPSSRFPFPALDSRPANIERPVTRR